MYISYRVCTCMRTFTSRVGTYSKWLCLLLGLRLLSRQWNCYPLDLRLVTHVHVEAEFFMYIHYIHVMYVYIPPSLPCSHSA